MLRLKQLRDIYGSWALVAGASEGLGLAFAEQLAAAGFNLVLVARREALLRGAARSLSQRYDIETRAVVIDLAASDATEAIASRCADIDLGLLVYNAAYAPRGPLEQLEGKQLEQVVSVNVLGPLRLVRRLLPGLRRRVETEAMPAPAGVGPGGAADGGGGAESGAGRHGARRAGIILMSSLAGNQGSPGLAAYAASKAFNTILAESLWHELRPMGIDVLGCIAGAVRTPGLKGAVAAGSGREAPGTLDADAVVRSALTRLGGGPVVVPGLINKLARFSMGRLFPKRAAIGIMAASTRGLGGVARRKPGSGPEPHRNGDES